MGPAAGRQRVHPRRDARCPVVLRGGVGPDSGRPGRAGRSWLLGCGINTPLRKPPDGKLPAFAQINNRAHSQARAAVERTIALLKQWRGLSGGYRGPLARFPVTLRTVVALEKFRIYETPF